MKKLRIAILLVLAAALCLSAMAETYVYAIGDANVRSGPGLGYGKKTMIPEGDTATYLDDSSVDDRGVVWYKVRYDDMNGWVSSVYAKLGSTDGSVPGYDAVKVSDDANVRSGPGLDYSVKTSMSAGQTAAYLGEVSVDERDVAWYKVKFGKVTGWVSSKYGKLISSGSSSSGGSSSGAAYVKVSGGNANVRSGPGLDYTGLDVMHSGETATYLDDWSVDDRGVTWYKVKFGKVTGWVSSKYAKLYEGKPSSSSSSSGGSHTSGYVYATGGDANVRSGPGLAYEQLTTMYEGECAKYLKKKSVDNRGVTWYKVKFGKYTGWVSSKYGKLY